LIHHGEPFLAGTATTVRAVAEFWKLGLAPEEISQRLPHFRLAQVFAALAYYFDHVQAIEAFIAANQIPEEWSGKRFDPATSQVQ
jgi:uncharacterized protein (DUF433 family)